MRSGQDAASLIAAAIGIVKVKTPDRANQSFEFEPKLDKIVIYHILMDDCKPQFCAGRQVKIS